MDRLHERKYHPQHEPWVKEPKDWPRNEYCHEQPAEPSLPKSESFSEPRMLNRHSRSLNHEISCREAIACASGQRDNQIVYQTGKDENQEASHAHAERSMQWAKNQFMRKLTKPKIPSFPPELAKGRGA
jgi:hypothetical protein